MIYLKLRQAGQQVNYKRVKRLYPQAYLQVWYRKREMCRPAIGNCCCGLRTRSMNFVFDRAAQGRAPKCLTIVDDAKREERLVGQRSGARGRRE